MMCKWILAALLALSATISSAAGDARSLIGRWTVTDVSGAQETTSLSSDDVDKLIGADFVVTPQSVQFSREICDKPRFQTARHSTASFFRREAKLDPSVMRLPDPITEITIDCLTPSPISFVYIRDKRHIVFYWRGFFLNAERRVNPDNKEGSGGNAVGK